MRQKYAAVDLFSRFCGLTRIESWLYWWEDLPLWFGFYHIPKTIVWKLESVRWHSVTAYMFNVNDALHVVLIGQWSGANDEISSRDESRAKVLWERFIPLQLDTKKIYICNLVARRSSIVWSRHYQLRRFCFRSGLFCLGTFPFGEKWIG